MKREARARHASGGRQSPGEGANNPTKPTIHSHRRTASSGHAHELTAPGSGSPKREAEVSSQSKGGLQRRGSLKDDKLRAAVERIRDNTSPSPSPQGAASENPPDPPKSYSLKLSAQVSDSKPRKLHKAHDLFAKLKYAEGLPD
jgi:hypothetical protein